MEFEDLKCFHKAVEKVEILDCKDILLSKKWLGMFSSEELFA